MSPGDDTSGAKPPSMIGDLREAGRLAVEATEQVTRVAQDLHHTIASGPAILGRPLALPSRFVTGLAYGSVRAAARVVGSGVDGALAAVDPWVPERLTSVPAAERAAVVAALNGVLGDHLHARQSPLAIEMTLRHGGRRLELEPERLAADLPQAGETLLLLIHGSSMHDGQWNQRGHDHGAALADELGMTPVHVHYNSGLHISTNGRRLAELLDALERAWPVPLEQIVLLGHSMGGLVARSACHVAEQGSTPWRSRVSRLLCLGTPHHGAALERAGSLVEPMLSLNRYSAPLARLGRLRSAGVTDLRYGNVRDEDWVGRDRFEVRGDERVPLPLPLGVACYAIAGSTAPAPRPDPPGDGIVAVDSALGRHSDPTRDLGFPEAHQRIVYGTGHVALLHRTEVYDTLRGWM